MGVCVSFQLKAFNNLYVYIHVPLERLGMQVVLYLSDNSHINTRCSYPTDSTSQLDRNTINVYRKLKEAKLLSLRT